MSRHRRTLRPEEEELWQSVARTAQRLHPETPRIPSFDLPPVLPAGRPEPSAKPIEPFRIGEARHHNPRQDVPVGLTASVAMAPLKMDAKAFSRMSRGKLTPEARIDLHGMTLAEAHPELVRFVLNAQSQALRLVLVITGKGRRGADDGPIPQRQGALRHQVPIWLGQPPLVAAVLQVAEAHLRHGGGGAIYVYLRKPR